MRKMTPFLIEAMLDSPVIIAPEAYLTLDSLLSASCQLHGENHTALPLVRMADMYHASAGILVGNPISSEAAFIARMTVRDYSDKRIIPNKRTGLVVSQVAFPDKARLDRYQAFHVPKMIWFGCGDPGETYRILSRLPGIGKRCNSGFGQVSSFTVLPIQEDFSIKLPDNTLARPIPVSVCQQLKIDTSHTLLDKVTYKPDYFDFSHADICALPSTRQITEDDVVFIKGGG